MGSVQNLKPDWSKIKGHVLIMSQEALKLAQKGEKELRRLSRKGQIYLDAAALELKKEHLYLLIGKEYIKAKCPAAKTGRLHKLIAELERTDLDLKTKKRLLTPGSPRA